MQQDRTLRAIWDRVPDAAVYRLIRFPDGGTRFECVSAGFESLFELPEGIVLRDAAPLYALLHPRDRDEAIGAQKRSQDAGTPFRHECRFNLPSGKTRWVRWHSMPEPLPDGGVAWNGVAIDVTARKQAEAALQELNATLEQRVAERTAEAQQRSRQLAELATELTLVEQRERRRLADYLHDHLQQLLVGARIQTHALALATPQPDPVAVERLSATLNQAIEAGRAVSQQLAPPVAVANNLPEAFQWLVNDVRHAYNLEVRVTFRGELTGVPEAESILLFTAARELLFNVVKHSGVLEAGLSLARGDGAVVLEVADAGRGLPLAASETRGGHGFGLFSIRERTESMGGSLTVDSSPGHGVRVAVRLPLAAAPLARPQSCTRELPVEVTPHAGSEASVAVSGPIRVMFVDDHQIVRQSLVRLFSGQSDIEVVGQCGDGQQAVDCAGRFRPDVVVMDVSMPVMDGITATRLIKERWPGIKVIGLSMHDDAHGGERLRAAGADGYVSKAGPPEELIGIIRQCGRTALTQPA